MDEYIKRATVTNHLDACMDTIWKPEIVALKCFVEGIPAADVAPVRHGRWITWEEAGNDIPSPHRHECSVCHDAAQVLVNGVELLSDYCPNCGARMDGTE
jgi:hypothetical protein